jgi:hypothetical protein
VAIITHPDLPFELEHVGQEVICRYPEGAEAIASRTEYLAALLLVRLDRLIEGRKSTPITEGPVLEQVLEVAEEAIVKVAAEESVESTSKKKVK